MRIFWILAPKSCSQLGRSKVEWLHNIPHIMLAPFLYSATCNVGRHTDIISSIPHSQQTPILTETSLGTTVNAAKTGAWISARDICNAQSWAPARWYEEFIFPFFFNKTEFLNGTWNSRGCWLENRDEQRWGSVALKSDTLYRQKAALISPTSGG